MTQMAWQKATAEDRIATTGVLWGEEYHERNPAGGVNDFCACCGRRVNRQRAWYVEVVDGGFIARVGTGTTTGDGEVDGVPGWMGFYPVGPECGKRVPLAFRRKF